MDNEAKNTDQAKDNVAEETERVEEPQVDEAATRDDAITYAPNDPFAPPRERKITTGEMPLVPIVSAEDAANPDIGGDIEVERVRVKRRHPVLKAFATLLVIALIVCGAACGWLVFDDNRNASCHVPEGVTLDGDNVSGLSENEVKALVEQHILTGNVGMTELDVAGQKYKLDFARLGSVNVDGTVRAVMATIEPDRVTRCKNRALSLIGKAPAPKEVSLRTVCAVDETKVSDRIESIAAETNAVAVDASYAWDNERHTLKMTAAKDGQTLNVKETTAAVMDAAEKGLTSVTATVAIEKPKKAEAGYAIFVNRTKCFLYLYKNGRLEKTCSCSPGPKDYPTPEGNWTITAKDAEPTWVNPHTEWSSSMPETYAPGESNPLGLRALELSCGGNVYIHGTNAYKKLGSARGHGSVAIGNDDIVELFDLVDVGTPVFIH